ncbi:MAG: hypothetical protein ACXQTL_02080, partial [Methanosarcinales archaeon]
APWWFPSAKPVVYRPYRENMVQDKNGHYELKKNGCNGDITGELLVQPSENQDGECREERYYNDKQGKLFDA